MRVRLHTYLFLCLGLTAVVPVLLLGAVRVERMEALAIAQSESDTSLAAEALAREVSQLMQAHTHAVEGLARQVEAAGTLDPRVLQGIVTAQHLAASTLGNMWVANAAAISQAVDPPFDSQGQPNAGTNYSDRDYYKKLLATNATSYSRAQLGRITGRPNLQVVEPIRDPSGAFIGFAQGAVDVAQIAALADRLVTRSPGMRAIILDGEGRTLAHPDADARKTMRDLSSVAIYRRSAGDVELRTGPDEEGIDVRAAVTKVPLLGLEWTVVVSRTKSAVAAHAAQARLETFITAGVALAAGLALAGVVASVFARPIVHLAALAINLGRGDLSALPPRPPAWLPREVGLLLDAVREMVLQLRTRTADLDASMQRLEHQSLHDALTGLPNRVLLLERLTHALEIARRESTSLALLILDLDRFKEVNDTLGHDYGDLLLQEVAARIQATVRASDTVARLGGDEFALLLPASDLAGANAASRKVLRALEDPFMIEGEPIDVGGSIGIALYPDHGSDATTLLRQADVAMYTAKAAASGQAHYAHEQDSHRRERLALIGELRNAINCDELALYYQPKVALTSGRVVAVEALARWPHPQRGWVAPDEFVPLAEQTGLIRPFSHWVLNAALRQCRAWRDVGVTLQVGVNLSMRNLHDPELPDTIRQLLATWQIPGDLLRIEVTESSLMRDADRTLNVLTRLRMMGVQVDIDDFGTGYSSLGYLKRLPVSQIKIDRSFVGDMVADQSDLAIVRSTVELAHNLGLEVVAEGVEDRSTWDVLTAIGCDVAQGYYLSRPMPASDLLRWLAESEWTLDDKAQTAATSPRASAELRNLCLPHLMRLRELTGETARLHAPVGLQRVCLDQVTSDNVLSVMQGQPYPLYSGAASKVILAFLPPAIVENVLEHMAPSTQEDSDARRAAMRVELQRIRATGHALGTNADGLMVLAAPVIGADGYPIASLAISGPAFRVDKAKMEAFAPALIEAASDVSRQLRDPADRLRDAA